MIYNSEIIIKVKDQTVKYKLDANNPLDEVKPQHLYISP